LGKTSNTVVDGTGTEFTIVSYSYTPVSSSSVVLIEFDANYTVPGNFGGTVDEVTSRLKVDGTTVQSKAQRWAKLSTEGVESRTPVLFPIKGKYVNTGTTSLTISVTALRTSGDDGVTVLPDMTLQITEIAQ
jgi:hypothetical protein